MKPKTRVFDQISGHVFSGLNVAWIFVHFSPDHVCPRGRVSFNRVSDRNRSIAPEISDLQQRETSFRVAHTMFVFLEHDDEMKLCRKHFRNHASFPIRLVLVVALQSLVCLLFLEDHCDVFSFFCSLPNSLGWLDNTTFSCQICRTSTIGNVMSPSGTKIFPAIPQRLL